MQSAIQPDSVLVILGTSGGKKLLFWAGWLLLLIIGAFVEVRATRAAKTAVPYLSPLDGTEEDVPARLRVWQYWLWAFFAVLLAMAYVIKGEYLFSSVWFAHVIAALWVGLCAWPRAKGDGGFSRTS
jgi:hypothetical protein